MLLATPCHGGNVRSRQEVARACNHGKWRIAMARQEELFRARGDPLPLRHVPEWTPLPEPGIWQCTVCTLQKPTVHRFALGCPGHVVEHPPEAATHPNGIPRGRTLTRQERAQACHFGKWQSTLNRVEAAALASGQVPLRRHNPRWVNDGGLPHWLCQVCGDPRLTVGSYRDACPGVPEAQVPPVPPGGA